MNYKNKSFSFLATTITLVLLMPQFLFADKVLTGTVSQLKSLSDTEIILSIKQRNKSITKVYVCLIEKCGKVEGAKYTERHLEIDKNISAVLTRSTSDSKGFLVVKELWQEDFEATLVGIVKSFSKKNFSTKSSSRSKLFTNIRVHEQIKNGERNVLITLCVRGCGEESIANNEVFQTVKEGDKIKVNGARSRKDVFYASKIKILSKDIMPSPTVCTLPTPTIIVPTPTMTPSVTPSPTPTPTITPQPLFDLPVEVFGTANKIIKRTFVTDADTLISSIFMQCHRCTYRDVGTNPTGKAKVSIRIDESDWLDITPNTVKMMSPEKDFGGFGTTFYTTRFNIDFVKTLKTGSHSVEFRFNGTDGITNGFRVLDFNIVSVDNKKILPISRFASENPALWKPLYEAQEKVNEGKLLWSKGEILNKSEIDKTKILASCADCHDALGADLKYFNFSNESIIARSEFHGLSNDEGVKIASYIRLLPSYQSENGRPWNPPYQPGKGIDKKNAKEWSAGAGLGAVLEHDSQTLDFLFPEGTSQSAIDAVTNRRSTLNIREIPVVLQMPDWNAWLPDIHPKDLWRSTRYSDLIEPPYKEAIKLLTSDLDNLVETKKLPEILQNLHQGVFKNNMIGGAQPCVKYYRSVKEEEGEGIDLAVKNGFDCEETRGNLARWILVKNWELVQRFNLESLPSKIYAYGEKRGWVGMFRTAFDVPAHRSANNSKNFKWQTENEAATSTAAWYHTELLLTASGSRERATFIPQDWFYTPLWIGKASQLNNANLGAFMAVSQIKKYQIRDTTGTDGKGVDYKMNNNGYWIAFMHPWWLDGPNNLYEYRGQPLNQLDSYEENLRVKVIDSLLRVFLDKVEPYTIAELADYDPSLITIPYKKGDTLLYPQSGDRTEEGATAMYRVLVRFKEIGIPSTTRERLIVWSKKMWPGGDWNSLKD
jgi:hypothetical protein